MDNTQTPPPKTAAKSSALSLVEQALLKFVLPLWSSLPQVQRAELAADLGILIGNAVVPAEKAALEEIKNAFQDTAEFSRPTSDFDAQFDGLRREGADDFRPGE